MTEFNIWNLKAEPLPESPKQFRKISFCTSCKNRTHDLKQTYIKNIEDNKEYPNIEWVLLNYNSEDDMEEWVKENLMTYIEKGIVNYYRNPEPKYFLMSHSRNMSFKLATGDIINNVDADNFINKNVASTINLMAEIQPEKAIFCKSLRKCHGRIGMYKNEFFSIGGYDEMLTGYGHEDTNLLSRLLHMGYKLMWYNNLCSMSRLKISRKIKFKYLEDADHKKTGRQNIKITNEKILKKEFVANLDRTWGCGKVIKNFGNEIII